MFPVSVRRHSLFTLYIRNFLHILLLEYMPQKASPQGENDTLWAHVIDVQIYSRSRRHSQYSLEDPVQSATSYAAKKNPLTEIQEGELYLCLEHRTVRVRERIINLTSKEFDILALLIANPKRVFTYELITDLVWKEDCDFYSRKAIHNHISKLRKKLRFEPDLPNYIESVAGIGYKFEHL